MEEIRTLCSSCRSDYGDAGYNTRFLRTQLFKGSCDICGRPGWEYIVSKRCLHRKDGGNESSK